MAARLSHPGAFSCSASQGEWVVDHRNCNHSAFNGYNETPSRWSQIRCIRCGAIWRSKAAYVDKLKDGART